MSLPPLMKTPKSITQLTAEKQSKKKKRTYQKDTLHPKTKKKPHKTVGGAHSQYNQIS